MCRLHPSGSNVPVGDQWNSLPPLHIISLEKFRRIQKRTLRNKGDTALIFKAFRKPLAE